MKMRDIEQVTGDIVDSVVDADLAARRAEASFARERNAALVLAVGADVECVAGMGIAAGRETLNDFADVSALIWRNLVFQPPLAPLGPVVTKDVTETVVGSGMTMVAPGG